MSTMKQNIKRFFQESQKMEEDRMKLKMLVTYHIVLADRFAGKVMQRQLENWNGFSYHDTELCEFLRAYGSILIKISSNYECYNQCKYQQYFSIHSNPFASLS